MARGWHRQSRRHRKAAYKGIIRSRVRNLAIKGTTPEKEYQDYKKLRRVIRERRTGYGEVNQPELNRYEHFQLPSQERTDKIRMEFKRMPYVRPIEIKTPGGELKTVDFKPSSRGWGGLYDHDARKITIDNRLLDKTDWTIRKGTIAHEYQHSVDMSEYTPRAVHNIVRQTLIQSFPNAVPVGTYAELKHMARRLGKPIKKRLGKQLNGEPLIIYSFNHKNDTYAYGKDIVWMSRQRFVDLAKTHKKPIKTTTVEGVRYRYIPFLIANVFEEK